MWLMCFVHNKSSEILTPNYLAESVSLRPTPWRVLLNRVFFFLVFDSDHITLVRVKRHQPLLSQVLSFEISVWQSVWFEKVRFIIVSSAMSLILLSIMSNISFTYKIYGQGPNTEPWGTLDMTGQVSDSSPSSTSRLVLFERKDPTQVITSLFMQKRWSFCKSLFPPIKGLVEINYNDVSLINFIKYVRDILYKWNYLGFTAACFAETMLV